MISTLVPVHNPGWSVATVFFCADAQLIAAHQSPPRADSAPLRADYRDLDRFQQFHDLLYLEQDQIGLKSFDKFAKRSGIHDLRKFDESGRFRGAERR